MASRPKDDRICAICGGLLKGSGNNAEPLAEGRCCDRCNEKVISARLSGLGGKY